MNNHEIILFNPDIPQNTGNIARTCAATGTGLTLVRPLGFSLASKFVKRSGLDYWQDVHVQVIDSLEMYLEEKKQPFYFFSSKGKRLYTDVNYEENALLIFGSETQGLPLPFHERWNDRFYKIPMRGGIRSLNLANAVAIVLYEALRQRTFKGLL